MDISIQININKSSGALEVEARAVDDKQNIDLSARIELSATKLEDLMLEMAANVALGELIDLAKSLDINIAHKHTKSVVAKVNES